MKTSIFQFNFAHASIFLLKTGKAFCEYFLHFLEKGKSQIEIKVINNKYDPNYLSIKSLAWSNFYLFLKRHKFH